MYPWPAFPDVTEWNLQLKKAELYFWSWTCSKAIYLSEVTLPTSGQILHRDEIRYSDQKKENHFNKKYM